MTSTPFLLPCCPGGKRLIAQLDAAVDHADVSVVVKQVEQVLLAAIVDPAIEMPAVIHEAVSDHYARRELYRSPLHGYSVIAMTWGAGQGTPLHDHDGQWCVEGVWHGTLKITPYQLLAREGERHRFQPHPCIVGNRGSAGNLIPPDEFHVLRNASAEEIAISIHVYQQPLERCSVFEPVAEGSDWYLRRMLEMATDPTPDCVS